MWHNLCTMLLRQVRTLSSPCLFSWICTLKISSAMVSSNSSDFCFDCSYSRPASSFTRRRIASCHQALTVEELTANHLCLGSAHTPQTRECSASFYIIILSSFFKFQPWFFLGGCKHPLKVISTISNPGPFSNSESMIKGPAFSIMASSFCGWSTQRCLVMVGKPVHWDAHYSPQERVHNIINFDYWKNTHLVAFFQT